MIYTLQCLSLLTNVIFALILPVSCQDVDPQYRASRFNVDNSSAPVVGYYPDTPLGKGYLSVWYLHCQVYNFSSRLLTVYGLEESCNRRDVCRKLASSCFLSVVKIYTKGRTH